MEHKNPQWKGEGSELYTFSGHYLSLKNNTNETQMVSSGKIFPWDDNRKVRERRKEAENTQALGLGRDVSCLFHILSSPDPI